MSSSDREERELSDEKIKEYAKGLARRKRERKERRRRRRQQAREIARRCAEMLRDEYGAHRVVLFGSAAREDVPFYSNSDIDLAERGVPDEKFLEAYGRCSEKELSEGFQVQLVPIEDAYDSMKRTINNQGIELL